MSSGALNSALTNQPCLLSKWKLFTVATFGPIMEVKSCKRLCCGFISQFRCRFNSRVSLTETRRNFDVDSWFIVTVTVVNSNLLTTCFTGKCEWRLVKPSVLWRCWLGGRKGIRPVKNWVVWCWRGYLSGARCRLVYGPADATATHCLVLQ